MGASQAPWWAPDGIQRLRRTLILRGAHPGWAMRLHWGPLSVPPLTEPRPGSILPTSATVPPRPIPSRDFYFSLGWGLMKLFIRKMERLWQFSTCQDWLISLMQVPLAPEEGQEGWGREEGRALWVRRAAPWHDSSPSN